MVEAARCSCHTAKECRQTLGPKDAHAEFRRGGELLRPWRTCQDDHHTRAHPSWPVRCSARPARCRGANCWSCFRRSHRACRGEGRRRSVACCQGGAPRQPPKRYGRLELHFANHLVPCSFDAGTDTRGTAAVALHTVTRPLSKKIIGGGQCGATFFFLLSAQRDTHGLL